MLEKSGEVDGVYLEWHTFEHDGKKITACFSDPDEPMWEFWCGKRMVALFDHAGDGNLSLCTIDEHGVPMKFLARNQDHISQGFAWLLGGKKPKGHISVQLH